ncbi:unnamed protein product [Miscanthus lutarioriparius]|uniref:F-box/LRR-repeat protein 15/At3g58940/PEG3-like LRR domain-containing protein n=1 Tax=Miscanthus lutarioriparius TaxID=422564 RepID=A0A811NV41_9POAL|nr:unnamed protein product [Miscanthus lutarioriparius]
MGVLTRAKNRRLDLEERLADWISSLPDGVLGDIVSLLPTKDGARTQVLSSHSAGSSILASNISHILSAHPGPCHRFVMPRRYVEYPSRRTLDGWLRSPLLDNLQELDFNNSLLLPSVHRLSSTLCVARFGACRFADGNDASPLQLPLLKQLTLFAVEISESSLHALLAGCPVLESLLLLHNSGFRRLQIVSSSLRSVGVDSGGLCGIRLQQLDIDNAPCLERLLYFGRTEMNISVISAPRLAILGKLFDGFPRLQFGATVFQGATIVSMSVVVSSVKVLAIYDVNLCLDALINLLKCFPHLQKLYIEIKRVWGKDWCTYRKLDIGLRKIVLRNYRGNK